MSEQSRYRAAVTATRDKMRELGHDPGLFCGIPARATCLHFDCCSGASVRDLQPTGLAVLLRCGHNRGIGDVCSVQGCERPSTRRVDFGFLMGRLGILLCDECAATWRDRCDAWSDDGWVAK